MQRRTILKLAALGGIGAGALRHADPAFAQGAEQPRRGGTLTMTLTPEPTTLFPATGASFPIMIAGAKMFDPLIRLDFDFSMKPMLAESWDISADRLTWTFRLRRGVKWHDGRDFTSADVAFTMMEVWKKLHVRGRNALRAVEAAETPDPHTVVFKLSAPVPYFASVLSSHEGVIVPRHIYEGTNILSNPANQRPVGTGPFRFREWVRGSHIIMERNPDYWDAGKPYLDRIIARIIPDAASRAAALESGEILLAGPNHVPLNDTARLGRLPHLEVHKRGNEYSAAVIYLQFNVEHPVLGKPAVRRALAHAVDQNFIVQNIMFGLGTPATGVISPYQRHAYTDQVARYPLDPARAERLLDEAGHPRGAGGVRFAMTLDAYTLGEHYVRIAEYLREALGRIGVRVTLRTEEAATFVRRVYTQNDYEALVFAAVLLADPTVGLQRLLYSGAIQRGMAFTNASNYRNPRVDALFEACQTEGDPEKRRGYWHELQRIVQDELPLLALANWDYTNISNRRVRNFVISPHAMFENFADMWLAS
ncbi:MAG: ABC transporter substrate-binding protein [Alphaproteobacteria bacterium]|nr:ABC transporter substrate-binding protein [Alphaproteobacteria bacterium]